MFSDALMHGVSGVKLEQDIRRGGHSGPRTLDTCFEHVFLAGLRSDH